MKKKAMFDKVLFAKSISISSDQDSIPLIIGQVIEAAKDLTRKGNFIKR